LLTLQQRRFACENHDCTVTPKSITSTKLRKRAGAFNQKPPSESTILRKLDLTEFREAQIQQVQESSRARQSAKGSPRHEQKYLDEALR
jgi:hypothetical protein